MPRLYGHEEATANRLTAMANEPRRVGRANLRPRRQPRIIGDGALVYCVTPEGGIPAMTRPGSAYIFGEATCEVVDADGEVSTETIVVRNSVSAAISGDILIGVEPLRDIPDKYGIVVGNC